MIRKINNCLSVLFSLTVILVLLVGWRLRRFDLITAESGTGNILGIVGTLLMVSLFIYPARKRYQSLWFLGSVKAWFRIHMVLGIIGPLCILLHGNFHLGSVNSNVALISTLVIAVSGIIGRYIYAKIHYGLYGRQASLVELCENLHQHEEKAQVQFAQIPEIKDKLIELSEDAIASSGSIFKSTGHLFFIATLARFLQWKSRHTLNKYLIQKAADDNWTDSMKKDMQSQLYVEISCILYLSVKVSQFSFFERLFSAWHVLHIPLVYILAAVVIVHVIAVNLF